MTKRGRPCARSMPIFRKLTIGCRWTPRLLALFYKAKQMLSSQCFKSTARKQIYHVSLALPKFQSHRGVRRRRAAIRAIDLISSTSISLKQHGRRVNGVYIFQSFISKIIFIHYSSNFHCSYKACIQTLDKETSKKVYQVGCCTSST